MTKKVKEVIKMIERDGWELIRIKGDHRVYRKNGKINVIPGHLNDDIPIGTLKSILRTMEGN